MDKYYYLDEKREQKGPVDADVLKACGVTLSTLVWKEGMSEWKEAGQLPELVALLKAPAVPPPVPGTVPGGGGGATGTSPQWPPYGERKPDNWLVWSILSTVLCCLPFGIAGIVYASKVDNLWVMGRHDEARRAASKARMFTLIAVGVGILWGIVAFITGFFSALLDM